LNTDSKKLKENLFNNKERAAEMEDEKEEKMPLADIRNEIKKFD
jgi:hypothetical protein